jgi:polysaccharide pyruvyl transferase WcaK-like protein
MIVRKITRRLAQLRRDLVDRAGWTARQVRRVLGAAIVPGGSATHVLIAPPGAGNIGDQAMVEAFLASADRPTVVVTRGDADFTLPADLEGRARIQALPALFYGQGAEHRADLRSLGALVSDAATVSIVGADIMDGVYVLRSSLRRSGIAAACATAGVDTSVLGFSWNAAAPRPALEALRAAGAAGTRLLLRDPSSAARVREAGVQGVIETADIVFTDDRLDDADAARILAGVSGPVALVNASGLIARKVDQVREYADVIAFLRGRGIHVVLLPHVLRSTADDLTACRAVYDAVGNDGVTLVEEVLRPSTIRALGARAALTITGRMHLAIMSLSQGTPAITLATQGKVEGLVRLFDWPELCVTPEAGMARTIVEVAGAALDDSGSRTRIIAGADRARALARTNVDRIAGRAAEATEREIVGLGGRDGQH